MSTDIDLAIATETRQPPSREQDGTIRSLRVEIAALRQKVARLQVFQKMAYRDFLTGLHNRRYFEERLQEECARAARTANYAFAVLLIDVDDFKLINDTRGHAVGDAVLAEIAEFLRQSVREVDIVCRLGGDEFALLLPNTDAAGCVIVEERLRQRLITKADRFPCSVSLSLGAAAHPPGPGSADAILQQADTAMYLDKRRRKQARMSR